MCMYLYILFIALFTIDLPACCVFVSGDKTSDRYATASVSMTNWGMSGVLLYLSLSFFSDTRLEKQLPAASKQQNTLRQPPNDL